MTGARKGDRIGALLDAVVLDVGGTLVVESPAGTCTDELAVTLLSGVAGDLSFLSRRVRLAAATNTTVMREPEVRALLEGAGIGRYLEVIVTSVDVGASKPDPGVLLAALACLGLGSRERVLYVGDRATDADAAAAAGMPFAPVGDGGVLAAVCGWAGRTARVGRAAEAGDRRHVCQRGGSRRMDDRAGRSIELDRIDEEAGR